LNQNNIVTEIREKVAISNHANTGAYIFRSGKLLRSECEKLLSQGVASLGEYYTSNVIAQMIQQSNEQFLATIIDEQDFSCLGTPAQLKSFLQLIKQGQVQCK
jgi:bifunctional N-acetylglucosamine-1-phosphate-uridyltransferase/glucosamine-1-phosphate-acetyltransferase GlmU-like protein